MMDKKGEEMVEASMVLPLLILMILSAILTAVFMWKGVSWRTGMESGLARKSAKSGKILGVMTESGSRSETVKGITGIRLSDSSSLRIYELGQAKAIRLGDLANE